MRNKKKIEIKMPQQDKIGNILILLTVMCLYKGIFMEGSSMDMYLSGKNVFISTRAKENNKMLFKMLRRFGRVDRLLK